MAIAELSSMVAKPVRTPSDTRMLSTELENRKKIVEEMTIEPVGEMLYRSILLGILDPTTKQHTASVHGTKNVMELKRKIL